MERPLVTGATEISRRSITINLEVLVADFEQELGERSTATEDVFGPNMFLLSFGKQVFVIAAPDVLDAVTEALSKVAPQAVKKTAT